MTYPQHADKLSLRPQPPVELDIAKMLPFNTYMNSPFNQQTSPFGPAISPFGVNNAMPPFAVSSPTCACHTVVANGRTLLDIHERSIRTACDRTDAAQQAGASISWQGGAASMFRQRLNDCVSDARFTAESARQTRRLAWQAGA